ncbi:uncharacterized protein LOC132310451 [Cornus florida]|uniref:uncharacterized protein LOC132310451 n=1 Tax=Cornus florida TaxID=4283 RepID=UPI00289BFCBD|nr:uncharacterized protein LOC132310451 [Cornus florida]
MLSFVRSCFDEMTKSRKQMLPHYVYRDEMDKKSSPNKLRKTVDGEAKPLLRREEGGKININGRDEEKGGLRVKILMTKEEAARLLLKCKDGGMLEFKDVAHELVQIPTSRVTVVFGSASNDRVLKSIPEEVL